MRCLTNTDRTTAVEEGGGGDCSRRGPCRKDMNIRLCARVCVCVCVWMSNWTHAQPANPDPVCVYVCIGSLMSRRRSCGAD